MMHTRWIGAVLIVLGCGGCGFSMVAHYREEISMLTQLKKALQLMESELSCRRTPLPELFYKLSQMLSGSMSEIFSALSDAMHLQAEPNAADCMENVLSNRSDIPKSVRQLLTDLGSGLGIYDLEGQLKQLSAVTDDCGRMLEELNQQKEDRVRQYQTLGLCAGAGLAILLI